MNSKDIITLGLGLQAPWEITGQLLDTDKTPHELRLTIQAGRGERYACPVCGALCHAHDFKEMTWRHLNFFQHHCSHHGGCSPYSLSRTRRQADRGSLGTKRKQVHSVVRTGGHDPR